MNLRYWLVHPMRLGRRLWHYAYEKAHPGQKVVFNFAASGPLLAQIQDRKSVV